MVLSSHYLFPVPDDLEDTKSDPAEFVFVLVYARWCEVWFVLILIYIIIWHGLKFSLEIMHITFSYFYILLIHNC